MESLKVNLPNSRLLDNHQNYGCEYIKIKYSKFPQIKNIFLQINKK